jgi:hypothetical protein
MPFVVRSGFDVQLCSASDGLRHNAQPFCPPRPHPQMNADPSHLKQNALTPSGPLNAP